MKYRKALGSSFGSDLSLHKKKPALSSEHFSTICHVKSFDPSILNLFFLLIVETIEFLYNTEVQKVPWDNVYCDSVIHK